MWWPPDKIFVHLAPINGIPCTHVANFQDCEHDSDAFVNLVMRLISRSMKRHVLSITGKIAQKKRLENHNYILVLILMVHSLFHKLRDSTAMDPYSPEVVYH